MIKNLIFDLGNVIIDLDIPRTEAAFETMLGENYKRSLQQLQVQHIFEQYETGKVSEDTFISTLQQSTSQVVSSEDIKTAWNAMLLSIPPQRFAMLLQLKERYNVFLLSNTNKTHLDWVYKYLIETHQITDFESTYFHKAYYSHLIHLRKPNVDIYEYVLRDANILASESVFIDDVAANIEGAQLAGLNTIHHEVGAEIVDVMAVYLA
jgi:glucose-1-phosphatase